MKKAYIIRIIIASIILILSILAIFGLMYPIKIMDLQFTTLFEKIFYSFSFSALLLFALLLIVTFVFGRVYCSILCPFGILQEAFDIFYKKIGRKKKKNPPHKNYKYKYIIAFVFFSTLLGGSTVLIKYIDPYTIFSNAFSFSLIGIILSALVLILVFYKNRFFCTNICPVGAILGLISRYSIFKIAMDKPSCASCGVCARSCPSGCIDIKGGKIDNEMCIKCFKCVRVCPTNSIVYYKAEQKTKKKPKKSKKTQFNPTRREALIGLGALSAFGALVAIGVSFSKNMASKIKNIILPPGAVNANRMANKCLNCNLCINNCPTKILTKANKDFGAVHIDFSKGKGYCEYNCNNCGKVCPTGAIKPLNIGDKQMTRIAISTINKDACKKCGNCEVVCPTGAITKDDKGNYAVDGIKCIGCGQCKTVCSENAITVIPVSEQNLI